jgi:hypothetical protein
MRNIYAAEIFIFCVGAMFGLLTAYLHFSRTLDKESKIRYICFGKTMALTIYGETNWLEQPSLTDYQQAGTSYRRCVYSGGVKEYMPYPPLIDVVSN